MKEIRDVLKIKPQTRLLRKLAAHILKVPDEQFDMDSFCGTARCAFGHAPAVPEIRKLGLRIVVNDGCCPSMRLRKADDLKIAKALYPEAAGRHEDYCVDNFERAQFVFGITEDEAERVFGGQALSRKAVSNRLIKLAESYEKRKAKKPLKITKRKTT